MALKPNITAYAIVRNKDTDKIVIGKAVLNQKPVIEFIERMRARGFNVETDGLNAIIEGDNLNAYYDEIQCFAVDVTPRYEALINELRERTENQLNNI